MPSNNNNLNFKYGKKTGTGDIIKASTEYATLGLETLNRSAGTIYAAKNTTGRIEMYLDPPDCDSDSDTVRKRLDSRVYVGGLSDIPIPAPYNSESDPHDIELAKKQLIWNNYDVWIDTEEDPTSALDVLSQFKLLVVTLAYWNDTSTSGSPATYVSPRNKNDINNLANLLTIVVPNSADSNYNATTYPNPKTCFVYIDTDNPEESLQSGGSGS